MLPEAHIFALLRPSVLSFLTWWGTPLKRPVTFSIEHRRYAVGAFHLNHKIKIVVTWVDILRMQDNHAAKVVIEGLRCKVGGCFTGWVCGIGQDNNLNGAFVANA